MIQIKFDDRIRLISSILLLTKFASENSGFKPHPLKVHTIEYLESHRDHPCAIASRDIAETHWMDTFYQYAVLLDQKSGFALRRDTVFTKHNSERLRSFKEKDYSGLLRSFYDDTDIASLWKRTDDMWREVQLDCNACLQTNQLDDFLELFFGASHYQLVFVPNPLDPPTFGFGLNNGTTAYCTFGPPTIALDSEEPVTYSRFGSGLTYNAFHEFAHSLLNNALDKWPAIIDETKTLETTMTLKGWFPNMYPTWDNRFNEIFIRAATALYREQLEGETSARAMLDEEKRNFGIDVIDRMFLCLRGYLFARRRHEFHKLGEYLPLLSRELQKSTRPAQI